MQQAMGTMIGRRGLMLLALVTLVFFGAGGWALIVFVQDRSFAQVLLGERTIVFQIIAGSAAGVAIGAFAAWLIDRPFMRSVMDHYTRMIGGVVARPVDIVVVSLGAGIGEEIFFRGAIQHWLGIVATALLFVAIHGYLDPRNWRLCVYGVTLTVGMIILGWMAEAWGLVAPMAAHAAIDVVLLWKLARAFARLDHSVG